MIDGGKKYRCKLTPKQEMFCREYLVDLNATQAAIRAGYSAKTAGSMAVKLVAKSSVSEKIQDLRAKRETKTDITIERVLAEYAKIAFTDLPGIVSFNGCSMSVADFDALSPEQRACIKKFKVRTEVKLALDGEKVPVDIVEVELHSKQAALDSIGKHLGMFIDRKELTGKDGKDLIPKSEVDLSRLSDAALKELERLTDENKQS